MYIPCSRLNTCVRTHANKHTHKVRLLAPYTHVKMQHAGTTWGWYKTKWTFVITDYIYTVHKEAYISCKTLGVTIKPKQHACADVSACNIMGVIASIKLAR